METTQTSQTTTEDTTMTTNTATAAAMMTIDEISDYLESEKISRKAFWSLACDGDWSPLPRRTVEDIRAQMCSSDE